MSGIEEITATYTGERQRWGETAVIAAHRLNDRNRLEQLTLKGTCQEEELTRDRTYRFYGRWTTYKHPRTGKTQEQFHFRTFVESQPIGERAIINYIRDNGKGCQIGPARAKKIYDQFREKACRVIREDPELIAQIAGIDLAFAELLASRLIEREQLEQCTIEILDLLSRRGFPKDTSRRLIRKHGNRATKIVKHHPYELLKLPGCGFKLCDAMYLDLGHDPASLRRQVLAAWHQVRSDSSGHTWYTASYAADGIKQNIGAGREIDVDRALAKSVSIGKRSAGKAGALDRLDLNEGGYLCRGDATEPSPPAQTYYAESIKARNEDRLAQYIADASRESVFWPDPAAVRDIDDHQRAALAKCFAGPISILGGGPGTGKTFTAARAIELLRSHLGGKIAIGAPTGKAAVRITEAMREHGIDKQARTWHSLLGVRDTGSEGWSFEYGRANRWPYKLIVGDESSMVDTDLMASIFAAREQGTHVLLVGDVNQLAPVGHGAPLRDLIAAGTPYGELTEIKRNSGGIVEACDAIRQGKPWSGGDNLLIHETLAPEQQITAMLSSLEQARNDGLDPVWDCQVLCAVNEKSPISRKALNEAMQREINRTGDTIKGCPFRIDDKIVNTKNATYQVADPYTYQAIDHQDYCDMPSEVYVANGELARVVKLQGGLMIARLAISGYLIRIPRGKGEGAGCDWQLGYALSCHKAQGSEWKRAIVMIDDYPGARAVCDRSWVYTAISRAKSQCELIGKLATARRFCRVNNLHKRKTFLRERVCAYRADLEMAGI